MRGLDEVADEARKEAARFGDTSSKIGFISGKVSVYAGVAAVTLTGVGIVAEGLGTTILAGLGTTGAGGAGAAVLSELGVATALANGSLVVAGTGITVIGAGTLLSVAKSDMASAGSDGGDSARVKLDHTRPDNFPEIDKSGKTHTNQDGPQSGQTHVAFFFDQAAGGVGVSPAVGLQGR